MMFIKIAALLLTMTFKLSIVVVPVSLHLLFCIARPIAVPIASRVQFGVVALDGACETVSLETKLSANGSS